MIMTRKGNLMPKVSFSLTGHVTKAVVTLVPMIYSTEDWISWSVSRLMWPFWTEFNRIEYFVDPKSARVCCLCCIRWREIRIGRCSWTWYFLQLTHSTIINKSTTQWIISEMEYLKRNFNLKKQTLNSWIMENYSYMIIIHL